jgi:hypothetical protein
LVLRAAAVFAALAFDVLGSAFFGRSRRGLRATSFEFFREPPLDRVAMFLRENNEVGKARET